MQRIVLLATFLLLPVLGFILIIRRRIPEPPRKTSVAWTLLSTKLVAAHVYYVKRTARCRKGRSPSSTRSSSSKSSTRNLYSSSFTLAGKSFDSSEKTHRLRAWSSWKV